MRSALLSLEAKVNKEGFSLVIGIDEAGRGPLAGPVVASAVHLTKRTLKSPIRDSKRMTARARERAYREILAKARVGVGIVDHHTIDKINILNATFKAMTLAVKDLLKTFPKRVISQKDFSRKVCLLVDGPIFVSELPYAFRPIIGGDDKSLSIACASVVAKVTRDRLMNELDKTYPGYGFKQHKGYPTSRHKEHIRALGLSPVHRRTFKYT